MLWPKPLFLVCWVLKLFSHSLYFYILGLPTLLGVGHRIGSVVVSWHLSDSAVVGSVQEKVACGSRQQACDSLTRSPLPHHVDFWFRQESL